MKPKYSIPRHPRGFTLVELLVVIVIIAVLATLAFTGAQKAMDGAHQSKSVGNARQVVAASQLLSADYNGVIVHEAQTVIDGQRRDWYHHFLVALNKDLANNNDYSGKVGDVFAQGIGTFADSKALKATKKLHTAGHNTWRTFGYNNVIGAFGDPKEKEKAPWTGDIDNVSDVTTPDKLMLITQRRLEGNTYSTRLQRDDFGNGDIGFDLYKGSVIVGYFDGHVGLVRKQDFPNTSNNNPSTGAKFTSEAVKLAFGN